MAFPGGKLFFALHPNIVFSISCGTFIQNTLIASPQRVAVESIGSVTSSLADNSPKQQGQENAPSLQPSHLLEVFRKIQARTNIFRGNKFSPEVFGRFLSNFNT